MVKIRIIAFALFVVAFGACKSKPHNDAPSDGKIAPTLTNAAIGDDQATNTSNTPYDGGSLPGEDDLAVEVTTQRDATVTGVIAALGGAVVNELVIQTPGKETYVFKPEFKAAYWKYQGSTVAIRGTIEKRKITDKKTGKIITKNWIYPTAIVNP